MTQMRSSDDVTSATANARKLVAELVVKFFQAGNDDIKLLLLEETHIHTTICPNISKFGEALDVYNTGHDSFGNAKPEGT